jgi:hypothetical protein
VIKDLTPLAKFKDLIPLATSYLPKIRIVEVAHLFIFLKMTIIFRISTKKSILEKQKCSI